MKHYNKIILAGGTGQLGNAICEHFKSITNELILLSRSQPSASNSYRAVQWDGKTAGTWYKELEGADLLVNLAGKTINCRHNAQNRQLILDSRTDAIKALAEAATKCTIPPALWIQAASAAIYPHEQHRPMTEQEQGTGSGFMVDVCKAWETTFWEQTKNLQATRKAVLRISLVLGKREGVFPRLKNLVRVGLGGTAGSGKQMVSWIHEHDLAAMVQWIAEHKELHGPFNAASPNALSNADFMRTLRKAMGMPIGLPAPAFALKFGALLIGTEAGLILDSLWAEPYKLLNSGFVFKYKKLEEALGELV